METPWSDGVVVVVRVVVVVVVVGVAIDFVPRASSWKSEWVW